MQAKYAENIILDAGYVVKPLFPLPLSPLEEEYIDLTLIIPVYNAEKYLSKCLQSVLNQETTYRYEVICIDDGSTDNSYDILKQYIHTYIHTLRIYSQPNGGISAARNTGIEHAHGTYIGFVDNDDYVDKLYVERMLSAAFSQKADVVQVGYNRVDMNGKVLYSYNKGNFVAEEKNYVRIYDSLRGTIWGGCFHRNIFRDIRFPIGYWYEDMINKLVLLRLTRRLVSIDDSLYYWVAHSDSAMSTYWKSYKIQSVDQIWLPKMLYEYSTDTLGIQPDDFLYVTFLHEYSYMLFLRTHKLPFRIRRAVFTLAKETLHQMKICGKNMYAPSNYRTFIMWDVVCFAKFIYTEIRKRFHCLFS